jgi:hypothetical protein
MEDNKNNDTNDTPDMNQPNEPAENSAATTSTDNSTPTQVYEDGSSQNIEVKVQPAESETTDEQTVVTEQEDATVGQNSDFTPESDAVQAPPAVEATADASAGVTTATEAPAQVGVAASQMGKAPHRNNKKFAAVITIVVALLLAATAVYVYMSTNSNTEEAKTDTTTQEGTNQQPQVAPATTDDVDATAKEVEEAVNALDEASDFAEEDLSDSSLGL